MGLHTPLMDPDAEEDLAPVEAAGDMVEWVDVAVNYCLRAKVEKHTIPLRTPPRWGPKVV